MELISSKIVDGNIKGGIRLAGLDDKIPNYKKLVSKHPKRADINSPNPENVDSFFLN